MAGFISLTFPQEFISEVSESTPVLHVSLHQLHGQVTAHLNLRKITLQVLQDLLDKDIGD